jgi:hypothetical protein
MVKNTGYNFLEWNKQHDEILNTGLKLDSVLINP